MTPTELHTSHILGVYTLSGKPLSVPIIATCSSPLAPPSAAAGIPATRGSMPSDRCEVDSSDRIATDPLEEDTCRIRMGRKRHEGLLLLRVRRGRRLEARPVGPQYSKAFAPDVRSEGRHLTLRPQRKKEVIPVIEHRSQDRLDDQIIGIDQHVVRLKPGERQD